MWNVGREREGWNGCCPNWTIRKVNRLLPFSFVPCVACCACPHSSVFFGGWKFRIIQNNSTFFLRDCLKLSLPTEKFDFESIVPIYQVYTTGIYTWPYNLTMWHMTHDSFPRSFGSYRRSHHAGIHNIQADVAKAAPLAHGEAGYCCVPGILPAAENSMASPPQLLPLCSSFARKTRRRYFRRFAWYLRRYGFDGPELKWLNCIVLIFQFSLAASRSTAARG